MVGSARRSRGPQFGRGQSSTPASLYRRALRVGAALRRVSGGLLFGHRSLQIEFNSGLIRIHRRKEVLYRDPLSRSLDGIFRPEPAESNSILD